MTDDPAFASQQFGLQAAQEQNRYVAGQGEAMLQGLPGVSRAFQSGFSWSREEQRQSREEQRQAERMRLEAERHKLTMLGMGERLRYESEQHQMQLLESQSDLAKDAIHRQQAAEELRWAQALHQTDILEAQKKQMVAEANLATARAEREAMDLKDRPVDLGQISQEDIDYMLIGLGIKPVMSGGKIIWGQATDEEREERRLRRQEELERAEGLRARRDFMARYGSGGQSPGAFMTSNEPLTVPKKEGSLLEMLAEARGPNGQTATQPQVDRNTSSDPVGLEEIDWGRLIQGEAAETPYAVPRLRERIKARIDDWLVRAKKQVELRGGTFDRAKAIEGFYPFYLQGPDSTSDYIEALHR